MLSLRATPMRQPSSPAGYDAGIIDPLISYCMCSHWRQVSSAPSSREHRRPVFYLATFARRRPVSLL